MEEDLLLKQPADRRLGNEKIPDGPPGADEYDETKKEEKTKTSSSKTSRRKTRSPSSSKRKASPQPSRTRRSPSSPPSTRNRNRSPTPPSRRTRFRYSPDRRNSRFDRRRSPAPRDRERDRYRSGRSRRDNSDSRSRSRSPSASHSRRGSSRWSSKNKQDSPSAQKQSTIEPTNVPLMMPTAAGVMQHPPPPTGQYGMMQPTQSQIYGGDTYTAAYANAYAMSNSYSMPQTNNYNTYPTANPWGAHDAYAQSWMQQGVPDHNSQMNQQTEQANDSFPANKSTTNADKAPVSVETNAAHDAAVAQEAENQRDELKKQRASYIKKNSLLKKELRMLKDQRKDLGSGKAPLSPTTKGFVDENEKLQSQIQKKIATIENVVEMLSGVIGEEHVADREETSTNTSTATTTATAATVGRTVDKTDSLKATPKPTNNTVLKGISQTKLDQSRKISTSSNSNRDVVKHKHGTNTTTTTTSSDTSSSSSSSSTSGSSSSSEDEEHKKKKKKVETVVIKEDDDDSSPERLKHKAIESMKSKQRAQISNSQNNSDKGKSEKTASDKKEPSRFNYAFYDPEMHWCQRCNVFPKTAKDYLNHLHSIEHMKKETTPETPWHSIIIEDNFPSYENAPTKRMPIRGITFFAPATAWYCKLCCVWMGDLHCASLHLKSKLHGKKYSVYLDRNPNFEMNWLADRQRVLNMKNLEAATAPQITAVSTTAANERDEKKSSKKLEEKSNKKSKKSSEKKDKKKKKKRNKKHKKAQESSTESSSSNDTSSSDESETEEKKKKKPPKTVSPIKELDNPNPAASIRVSMRNNNARNKIDDDEVQVILPPPPLLQNPVAPITKPNSIIASVQSNNWSVIQEGHAKSEQEQKVSNAKTDDAMMQQWNVQSVISENEKKLLEQLKGKLKTIKPIETTTTKKDNKDPRETSKSDSKDNRDSKVERSSDSRRGERGSSTDRYRSKRSRSAGRSRSPTRSRSRGRDWRRARSRSLRRRSRGRRSRSRSRGRYSPNNRGSRRRRSSSRSHRRRSRSRSRNRRNRRSRTRSGSRGNSTAVVTTANNVEKPIVQHSEFRPRVPEKDKEKEKEKDKKSADSKDKKESKKSAKTNATNGNSAGSSVKKWPFIGKMPVFKKQTGTGQTDNELTDSNVNTEMTTQNFAAIYMSQAAAQPPPPPPPPPTPRALAPTAAQINMAMMEDAYGNAPPFHPEAGVMHTNMDYDDLMPDPVQFVNIMAQAPPPPGEEEATSDGEDVLPPGIDEIETEKFVPKPVPEEENDGGNLPKDLEEALNIIFPGERKSEDDEDTETAKESGETQIIVEEPVMQMDDLFKEGIHLVTIEETSLMAMDEASKQSMNEPLVFKKASTSVASNDESKNVKKKVNEKPAVENVDEPKPNQTSTEVSSKKDNINESINLEAIVAPDQSEKLNEETEKIQNGKSIEKVTDDDDDHIPMPPSVDKPEGNNCSVVDFNLDDIPNPPAPLTESEKKRRQEELDELAMLGIDADDMAAQRM